MEAEELIADDTPTGRHGLPERESSLGVWWHRHRRWIEPVAGLLLFLVAIFALQRSLRENGLREIFVTLDGLPASRVAAAVGLTAVAYAILTLYDWLGVRYAGCRLPYRTVAPASFVSYALSHNLGMAALTSVPMRFRFYSAAGLDASEITRVIVFVSTTFWLGVIALSGAAFVIDPITTPPEWPAVMATTRPLGFGLLALTLAYLVAVVAFRKPMRLGTFSLELPSLRIALLQLPLSVADLTAAAGVLYLLLPDEAGISFVGFVAVYLLALIGGVISQVPGGLGVFEAIIVTTLPPHLPGSTVLATLLAYRAIYYILPLFAAAIVLAVSEVRRHRQHLAPVWQGTRAWTFTLMPHAAAAVVFAAGAVLLFSGSMPGLPGRMRDLGDAIPLPVIELSHLLGSLAGVGLLFLARGLQRRLDSAYVVTVGLLGVGAVASLAKGLDYEEATLLVLVVLILLPVRDAFYRKGALLAERFTGGWFLAIAVVLGASLWLGLLASRHVEYSGELWWRFALHGDAPRFLRAAVAVAVVAVSIGLMKLVGRAELEPEPANPAALERAAAIVSASPDVGANLALLGDKSFLFAPDDRGFVMYAVEGRSWIAMGDPVGSIGTQRELAWNFRSLVDRYDGWPVFYEVRAENAPLYLDLGLTLSKLGEEAIVPLDAFSLEGAAGKSLRRARRVAEKEGCSFRVVAAEDVPPLLPELRRVSDAWLRSKSTREKRFSLGFFDEAYIRRFPQAVVMRDARIVAFANIWAGAGLDEISIDLMRYETGAPPGVMDYLFAELLLWAKAQGFRRFSLGMAPMSGMENHALTPLWNRVGAFLFRHAEDFYNFQGLRAYKDKFDPVWEPRYLASPAGFALPRILANTATLIGGGVRGVIDR